MTSAGVLSPFSSRSFFAASVRAPVVAVILVIELTAAYVLLLPLMIGCITAAVVARLLGGKAIYEMKCSACHKLTDQRVVGPGWAGVTNKRRPEWIMNMITNVDVMLEKDPEAQKLLEECLTRMPNQGVSIGDARAILEFMRQNDMDQVQSKDEAANQS